MTNFRLGPGEITYFVHALERNAPSEEVAANLRRVKSVVGNHALLVAEKLFKIDLSDLIYRRESLKFVDADVDYIISQVTR